MHIEVVTDGLWSVEGMQPGRAMVGAASALALHDEAVTKPALLYGSAVTLRSSNFVSLGQLHENKVRLAMPLRGLVMVAHLYSDRDWYDAIVADSDFEVVPGSVEVRW